MDTDDAVLHQLLEMSCVITRLRRLIQLFQSRPSKLRKRLKAQLDDEKLYRPSVSRKKARHAVSRSGKSEVATLETPPRKTMESRDCGLELVEQLRTRPWPSSPAKGFQQVDVSSPVKGRFRISLSSMSDAAQEFQEEDVSSPAEDRFRISLPSIIDAAEDEVNNPSTKVTTE